MQTNNIKSSAITKSIETNHESTPIPDAIKKSPDESQHLIEDTTKIPLRLSVSLELVKAELAHVPVKVPSLLKSKWLQNEIWKTTHISNEYFISTDGRCYSEKTQGLKNCKPETNGYINYVLMIDGKKQSFFAHELVAKAFIGPRPDGLFIDHIDRVTTNNKLINLRYVTPKQNRHNSTPPIQRGKPTGQYDLTGKLIKRWDRATDIANEYNFDIRILTMHIRKEKPYKGFIYKYLIDNIDGEIWKDIKILTGNLKISSYGRVKNKYYEAHYGTKSSSGYRTVFICNKTYQIHNLVCEHFNGPAPTETAIANHLDENKENNHMDNLKWVKDTRENTEYSMGRKISQYDKAGKLIAKYASIVRASEATGVSTTVIGRLINNIDKTSEFIFKYDDNRPVSKSYKATKIVIQTDLNGNEIKRFDSICDASRKLNIAESTIHYYCKNNLSGRGFKWHFDTR